MRTSTLSLSILLLAGACASTALAGATKSFGKPLQGLKPVSLASVLAEPKDGQTVRLEGRIAKVCPTKGCWLELEQGDGTVHVMFEGYSFFVPKDTAGRKVVLEGQVKVADPDPGTVEHLQGEGAGAAAGSRVSIVATGVEIEEPETPVAPAKK